MKVLSILLKSLAVVIAVLAIVGLFLPSESKVSRSTEIAASADKVFGYLNDFRQFNRWSPWAKIDPNTQYQFDGPDQGVGAKFSWSSDNPHVGNGSQEITHSDPGKALRVHLEFDGQGSGNAGFDLEPAGSVTRVTWYFTTDWGRFNIPGRYMGLMMDKWVGSTYAEGLENLKQLVESE